MPFCSTSLLCRLGACAFAVFAIFLSPSSALAQSSDLADMETYTLTMDKVNHLGQALTEIGAYTKEHPEARATLETSGDQDETLAAVSARMSSIPGIVAILTRHDLAPRDFLLVELIFVQSAVAVASKPIDQGDTEYAARVHINPANLAFMRDHRAELKPMQARLGVPS